MDVDAVYKPTNIAKGHHLVVCWWNMTNPHIPICHITLIVSLVSIPFLLETVVLNGQTCGFGILHEKTLQQLPCLESLLLCLDNALNYFAVHCVECIFYFMTLCFFQLLVDTHCCGRTGFHVSVYAVLP